MSCAAPHMSRLPAFGLTDALKAKFPCMHAGILHGQSGYYPLQQMGRIPFKHTLLHCLLAICEAPVQYEGRQVTEPRASLSTLHQLLPRCSQNFIPQIANVFEQC